MSLLVGGWIALSACSNQKEGERCDRDNNNEDCSAGLICVESDTLPTVYASTDRCCPPDRTTATTPACRLENREEAGVPPPNTGPDANADAEDDANDAGSDANDASDAREDASDAQEDG